MQKAITYPKPIGEWLSPENEPDFVLKTVTPGVAEAPLVGGNLSLLAAMCGTAHQIQGKDHIIFIEDVREAPYRIDRMLTQLRNAKVFEGCKGVLVGQFTNCDAEAPNSPWKIIDVIADRLGTLGIPVLSGAAVGHVKPKWTVPLGIKARMDATNRKVEVLESAVKRKE
ncbi:MAG: LD-carboxypeptidase [Fimbriimonadaceae bacterium]